MILKIKNLFRKVMQNPDYRALAENFTSLSALQVINYVSTIVTFPYLVKVLGVEKFGLLSFAQSFVTYFILLTNYGFSLTGIQQTALARNDKEKSGKILSSMIGAKTFLMIISLLLLTLIVISFEKFRQNYTIYYYCFAMVIAEAYTPYWFFRGIERMRYITIFTGITKTFYITGIFLFVKNPKHFYLVPLLSGISTLLVDIEAFRLIYFKLNYKLVIPTLQEILGQLKDGFAIFVSQVAINLYTTTNIFILGILTNNTYVGYYAAAQKILLIVSSLIGLIQQTFYPFVNRLTSTNLQKATTFIKHLLKTLRKFSFILSTLIFIFAPILVRIVLGPQYLPAISTISLLSFIPYITTFSATYGILVMLPLGYKKEYMKILCSASLINIILSIILVPLLKHNGTALSVTITEAYISLAMWFFLQKKRIII